MDAAIQIVVHILIAFALPPLLLGIIGKTKAFLLGEWAPPFCNLITT